MEKHDLNKKALNEIQKIVDDLKQQPQYAQYVKDHKLESLDSRLRFVDGLLDTGLIL